MTLPDPAAVEAAVAGLAGLVRRTPVVELEPAALGLDGGPLPLKLELLQRSGSFKARGATWQLLASSDAARDRGAVAASGGNFGIAVADAAATLDIPATIFVGSAIAAAKIERLRAAGAEVVVVDGGYPEAQEAAGERVAASGAVLLHPYDDPAMVAGNGSMAAEIDEQVPGVDTVVVAAGGGGLLAGVAAWFGDRVRLVAVETEGTATLAAALAAGEPVRVEGWGICRDSLSPGRVGDMGWAAVQRFGATSVVVADDDVVDAQRRLWSACRLAAEPGGACALAAVTSGAWAPEPGERAVVVVCGSNVDPATVV